MRLPPLGRALLAAALLAAAAATLPAPARAQVAVTPHDLFLAPSLVATGQYDTHYLTFGGALQVSQGYSSADVGGTLLGVRILPVLKGNPGTPTGVYTAADLAAIDASNFSQYFFLQPGVDYSATLTPGFVNVSYDTPGQYFVQILAERGGSRFTHLFHDQVDSFFMEDPPEGGKGDAGVERNIATPVADLYLVSTNDPAFDDKGGLDNAEKQLKDAGKDVQRVGSIDDVKKAIKKASEAAKKKIEVVLVGHGRAKPQGSVKIGTQRINNSGKPNTMKPEDFQKLIDDWTHSIQFYACRTGQDKQFAKDIAKSIKEVTTFTAELTFNPPSTDGKTKGYITSLADEDLVFLQSPEPATVVLVAGGALVLLLTRGRVRRRGRTCRRG